MGPFKLNNKVYIVIVKLKKYLDASEGFDETVESFSIVDNEGKIHYEKSFNIVFDELGFAEAVSIHGYALESCNIKFFRYDSGRLIGCKSRALVKTITPYYSPRHEFLLKAAIRHCFAITVAKTVFIKDNPNYQQC